ncbi:MAG: hypothetical protein N3B13_09640, partial [Deltaproteobacteria bacterium]|nr:hypothetical protein [Deltaproteobacteria bacterium]
MIKSCFIKRILYCLLFLLAVANNLNSMDKTYHYITSSNGYSAVVFDDILLRAKMFFPHIYRNINKETEVKNILYDTYFGISYNNKSFWLPERPEECEYLGYLPGTGIITVRRKFEDIETTEYIFSPMTLNSSGVVMIIKARVLKDIDEISLFSIHNFHLGLENNSVTFKSERILYDKSDIYIESSESSPYLVAYKPLTDGTIHAATPVNPYDIVKSGKKLTNVEDSGITDDAVCGFEKDFYLLKSGDEVWFGILVLFDDKNEKERLIDTADDFIQGRSVQNILNSEIIFWQEYFSRLDSDKKSVILSDAVLSEAVAVSYTH